MVDFNKELHNRIQKIDRRIYKTPSQKIKTTITPSLWEVRRRSPNNPKINDVIIGGLSRSLAVYITSRHNTHIRPNGDVIFYDILREDENKSIYYNRRPLIKEESNDIPDIEWKG